jgi:hypothetical protein
MQASSMTTEPHVLLEASIAQLRTLAAFFADELGNSAERSEVPTPEARACKEALLTISVLIPKLQAARCIVSDGGLNARHCSSCNDD